MHNNSAVLRVGLRGEYGVYYKKNTVLSERSSVKFKIYSRCLKYVVYNT